MTSDFELRTATIDDLDLLARIHRNSWQAGFESMFGKVVTTRAVAVRCTEERWQGFFAAGSSIWIASAATGSGGLIQTIKTDAGAGLVERLYVEPGAWGTGMARALMHEAVEAFRSSGVKRVLVGSADTAQAQRFYEKYGFVGTGVTVPLEVLPGVLGKEIELGLDCI